MARHAKLEIDSVPTVEPSIKTKKSFFDRFVNKIGFGNDNMAISRLIKRMVSISAAFFFVSSLGPLYYLTEGHHDHDGVSFIDFTDQETQSLLDDIMTEDGFLLKPALNSERGDRSEAHEIFAYEVEPGDTLSSLANRFGLKIETLVMENELWNVNNLKTGTTLKILPVDGISHLVKKGDTVSSIAKKYKIDESVIVRQNQLNETGDLLVDSALIIPGAKKVVTPPKPRYATGNSAPANPGSYGAPTASSGRLIWPTLGSAKLTQGFHRGHYALDIGNRSKGPIFAAAGGRVVEASYGWNGGYGNHIIVDHGNGMQTLYAHNEKLYVEVGQYVGQGDTIAWMGRSGRVYGPTGIHLHFEVRINGVKYNPMNFF